MIWPPLLASPCMLVGLLVTAVLVLALWSRRADRCEVAGAAAWRGTHRRTAVIVGFVLSLMTSVPLVALAPWVSGHPPAFWADDATHARVAAEIAAKGLPHGWIDGYLTGFPVGHHYPVGGWGLLAILIRLGMSPAGAASIVGCMAMILVPPLLYAIAIRGGARPSAGLAGAAFVAWVSPYNAFVGGWEVHYDLGLVSQELGLLGVMALGAAVLLGRRSWHAPVAAAATMVLHPQLAVAAALLLSVAVVTSGDRAAAERGARGGVALVCAGAALYAQGIGSLRVPFGWPSGLGWRHVGFPATRLWPWLVDGALFDRDRLPLCTAVLGAALVTAVLGARRPAARAAAVTAILALPLSVSGPTLAAAGRAGELLLSVLQPLRFASLLPLVAAALVVVAVEELASITAELAEHPRPIGRGLAALAPGLVTLLILAAGLPARVRWVKTRANHLASLGEHPCGSATPSGYDRGRVHSALAELSSGRLWYPGGHRNPVLACAVFDGLDAATAVPVAYTPAVGAHVGVLWTAMGALMPTRAGSALRAEALGVRYLLLGAQEAVADGWRARTRLGGLTLLEHGGPTDRVGVGCVREVWSGTDRELRAHVLAAFATAEGTDQLLDPERLIALVRSDEPWNSRLVPDDACSTVGARVTGHPREPGAVAATVDLSVPGDVVIRASAFPTWHVTVDGLDATPRVVGPGFFSVRVPPGRHEVVAVVSLLPGYWVALALGALGVAAAAAPRPRFRRSAPRRSGTRSPDPNRAPGPPTDRGVSA